MQVRTVQMKLEWITQLSKQIERDGAIETPYSNRIESDMQMNRPPCDGAPLNMQIVVNRRVNYICADCQRGQAAASHSKQRNTDRHNQQATLSATATQLGRRDINQAGVRQFTRHVTPPYPRPGRVTSRKKNKQTKQTIDADRRRTRNMDVVAHAHLQIQVLLIYIL